MDSDVEPDCRFCLANGLLVDGPQFGNDSCYFLASADPILPHGGMIIPRRHTVTPFELNEVEWHDTFALLADAKAHLDASMPDGYTLGWNVGRVGGQTIDHTHLHIIARFADEPRAGQGLRHHLKQPDNRRPGR
jgi:diadenosine tetraphosphate (Ap4A) HIT family hydrolase